MTDGFTVIADDDDAEYSVTMNEHGRSIIQSLFGTSTNNAFLIRTDDNETTNLEKFNMHSSDDATASFHPKLVITYDLVDDAGKIIRRRFAYLPHLCVRLR